MDLENLPYYFEELSAEDEEIVNNNFGEESSARGLVRLVEKNTDRHLYTVSKRFQDHAHLVYNMELREDDVWVVTNPKCGTTWTQEIVWNIVNGVDVDRIKESLVERSPHINSPMLSNSADRNPVKFFDDIDKMPSPRVIKTHYPFEILPPRLLETCKVIFVCRNVKDACVSYYHHNLLFKDKHLNSTFPEFALDLYMKSNLPHGGYFEMLRSGWQRKEEPNLLFVWYEEMKEDQRKAVQRMAEHLGYSLEEDKVNELCEATTFSNYKKISTMNSSREMYNEGRGDFIRKGVVGDWVNYFDQALNHSWNDWIQENLANIGVTEERIISYFSLND